MGNCAGKKRKDQGDGSATQAGFTENNDNTVPQTQQKPSVASRSSPLKKSHPPLPKVPKNEPTSPTGGVRLFVALFDYDARTSEDLTFKKGDYLEVKQENTAFDWWQAKSRTSKQEGYIPSNYVAEVKTLEAEE
jgi:hypothetical protein